VADFLCSVLCLFVLRFYHKGVTCLLSRQGWTPSEGNAENPIDCSSLEEDDLVDLQLRIPWFLFQLGERFRNEGCQRLDELRSQLEAVSELLVLLLETSSFVIL